MNPPMERDLPRRTHRHSLPFTFSSLIFKARMGRYPMPEDWIFANPSMPGKQPYWPDNLMKRHVRPVARAIGIHKRIG